MLRATLLRTLQASMPTEGTPTPYPLPEAFRMAMSVVADHAAGMTAVRSLLHDNGLEWDSFYSEHEPAEISSERAYLLAQELLRTIDFVAAMLPIMFVKYRWEDKTQVQAARATKTVFKGMMRKHFEVFHPLPAKSPNVFRLGKIIQKWCIANIPWQEESIQSTMRDNGVIVSRITQPNPHVAVLEALRARTIRCLGLCEAEVPAPRRLELQHCEEWDEYFERIFPTAPEAWRPHLLTFLRKYPVHLLQMLDLEDDSDDSDGSIRHIHFNSARAIGYIRDIAVLSTVIANGARLDLSSSDHRNGYPVLVNDPQYPTYLFQNSNDLPIQLIHQTETTYTVPVPIILSSSVSSAHYPHGTNRAQHDRYSAFWEKAIQRCQPNEVQITITGVREEAYSEMTIPPRMAREAAADLTALADALAGA